MNKRVAALLGAVLAANVGASYAAFVWAPVEATLGEDYRILYIHVPGAWVLYLSAGIALVAGVLYLIRRNPSFDRMAEVGVTLALFYGALTLVGGSVWSNAAWGTYWNWDPRQTSTFILWIAYMGYIALRASVENVERRAFLSATYNILAFATVPLSYLSMILWQSLHPQIVTPTGISLNQSMMMTLFLSLSAATLLYLYLFYLVYKVKGVETGLAEYEYALQGVKE